MECWICSSDATSNEHRLKRSDARLVFGDISSKSPIYSRNKYGKPISLYSDKSPRLLFESPICVECNTTLTQRYDAAWERLSVYVHDLVKKKTKINSVHLNDALGDNWRKEIINIQLYFAKLFGCRVEESNAPIDLSDVAKSIRSGTKNNHLYLGFFQSGDYERPYCNFSQLVATKFQNDLLVDATFIYSVDRFHVQVVYSTDKIVDKTQFWLPGSVDRKVKLKHMEANNAAATS